MKKTLIEQAEEIVRPYDRASAGLLQRRLGISYLKAAKLMDILEEKKIVAPSDGPGIPRRVLSEKK